MGRETEAGPPETALACVPLLVEAGMLRLGTNPDGASSNGGQRTKMFSFVAPAHK